MYVEVEKIGRFKDFMQEMANGVNPLDGGQIQNDSLLNDPRMIRCFYFIAEVLDNVMKGSYSNRGRLSEFIITPEQKGNVVFTDGKIGVNEFSKCINACLNLSESKKLTGVEINKRLKKLEILSEEITSEGKKRTITNEKSAQYGFEAERKNYNGVEYYQVVMNNAGKKYLLENIEAIMAVVL